jgi:hypothetical protein
LPGVIDSVGAHDRVLQLTHLGSYIAKANAQTEHIGGAMSYLSNEPKNSATSKTNFSPEALFHRQEQVEESFIG